MEIIRGTTPTLKFTFSKVSVNTITDGYLVIRQGRVNVIEVPLSESTETGEDFISFTLTQAQTLALSSGAKASVFFDWVTSAGVRGRSVKVESCVGEAGKNEVI